MDVEDGTGVCKVMVGGKEVNTLIGSPVNLYLDDAEEKNVLERLTILFGRNPFSCDIVLTLPLLDCCIMSYYSKGLPKSEEERRSARIIYRLFDTSLSPSPSAKPC